MVKNHEVLCKQYASTEKNIKGPKRLMAFFRTLVTALTIHVRTMSICCCPVQIFTINYLIKWKWNGYSQHYKISTSLKMEPQTEIKCLVQMNSSALRLIIVEYDPVDFIFTSPFLL